MDYQIKMTVTAEQARVISRALDVYVRLGLGQLGIVAEALDGLHDIQDLDGLMNALDEAKSRYLGLCEGRSYGIGNRKVDAAAHVAYDLEKGVQKVLATTEKHGTHSVWHHGNTLKYGSEPLATFSTIVDGVETPIPTKG
jgi:hypothetical protein